MALADLVTLQECATVSSPEAETTSPTAAPSPSWLGWPPSGKHFARAWGPYGSTATVLTIHAAASGALHGFCDLQVCAGPDVPLDELCYMVPFHHILASQPEAHVKNERGFNGDTAIDKRDTAISGGRA